jgi:hypothetical protein
MFITERDMPVVGLWLVGKRMLGAWVTMSLVRFPYVSFLTSFAFRADPRNQPSPFHECGQVWSSISLRGKFGYPSRL